MSESFVCIYGLGKLRFGLRSTLGSEIKMQRFDESIIIFLFPISFQLFSMVTTRFVLQRNHCHHYCLNYKGATCKNSR